ncbi:Nn.00g010400.m01.CDS01 [Neocucurbitaria sp. VM-36]
MLRTSLVIIIAFAFVREARAACYFRNGTETTSDYSPCSGDASNPMSTVCCATWDTCLPNGLCQSFDKVIWRESCTKQNWDEGGCQEICSNEREAQRNDNIKVTPCDGKGNSSSTTWCCGGNDACCGDGNDIPVYTIARRFGDPIPTPASMPSSSSFVLSPSATATNSASLASSSAPSASSSAPSASNGGLSTGAKAGIGIGAAFGAIALIVLGIFIYKALQWRKTAHAAAPSYTYPEELACAPAEVYQYRQEPKLAQLAGMESTVHEMPGSKDTSETCIASPDATQGQAVLRS